MSRLIENPMSSVAPGRTAQPEGVPNCRTADELTAWRRIHPAAMIPTFVDALRDVLAACEPPTRHRSWQDALDGDAAAAIRIALIVSGLCGFLDPMTDVAASGLMLHALRGDVAAGATLACLLRNRSARHPGDARIVNLASVWSSNSWPRTGRGQVRASVARTSHSPALTQGPSVRPSSTS